MSQVGVKVSLPVFTLANASKPIVFGGFVWTVTSAGHVKSLVPEKSSSLIGLPPPSGA